MKTWLSRCARRSVSRFPTCRSAAPTGLLVGINGPCVRTARSSRSSARRPPLCGYRLLVPTAVLVAMTTFRCARAGLRCGWGWRNRRNRSCPVSNNYRILGGRGALRRDRPASTGDPPTVCRQGEEVRHHEDPDAPRERDPDVGADGVLGEQAPDGVDDRRHRLVLGEPRHGGRHAVGRYERRADERQEDERVRERARTADGLRRQSRDPGEPSEREGEQEQDAGEHVVDVRVRTGVDGSAEDEYEQRHDRHGGDGGGDDRVGTAQDVAERPPGENRGVAEGWRGHNPTSLVRARKTSSRFGCFSTYSTFAGGSSCLSSARVPSTMRR